MPIYLGSTALNNFRVGTQTPDRIFLGNELVWPAFTEVTQSFTAAGSYTFSIPANCRYIDIIVLGGGGGGQASLALFNVGASGAPGQWNSITLKRGVDIPWSVTQITGSVGAAGPGGLGPSILPGGAGGDTTANYGSGTITGPGGAGGLGWASREGARGDSPGNLTFNGKTYIGGGASTGDNQAGKPPGGSGSGHYPGFGSGQNGAPGAAWFRAY
ncbi:minor tail protein [Mycobacterium phage BTCU-1]|uniref:Structural protein n=1 Tax=Mycobacterium phage BTCU-1 TaxID=1262532 RepID=R9R4H5_9CAUD|nr:minor tail protein [Mycobacterium phage BTCU-1]AGI61685.1 structural protein [Mycobacterium phage BTCU-1]